MNQRSPAAAFQALSAERRRQIHEFATQALPEGTSIVWEVGCGHGHFLAAYAQAHRKSTCVGIDISSDRIARALRKRERARLSNLHFLQAEAMVFLQEIPPRVTLAAVFILFPDPWPKLRHRKHRILHAEFLVRAAARATADCRIYFRTDHLPYFRAAAALLAAHPDWVPATEPWPFEHETVFQQRVAQHHSIVARRR